MRLAGRMLFALVTSGCGRLAFDANEVAPDAPCMTSTYHADQDGDGHGDPGSTIQACGPSATAVESGDDCDDTRSYVYPGASEVCDSVDNDCDAMTLEVCPSQCTPRRRPPPDDAHTYLLCGTNITWLQAETQCANAGFTLATITDGSEDAWLRTTVDATLGNVDVFIGGTDAAVEGEWRWPDGTQFWSGGNSGSAVGGSYTSWGPVEPNNGGSGGPENCLLVLASGTWNDADCNATMRAYACERN